MEGCCLKGKNMNEHRRQMLSQIEENPEKYVFAIEARTEFDGDIVTHISSTLEKARAYCLSYEPRDCQAETRLHIIPHLVDADDTVHNSGIISIAVYGIAKNGQMICDLTDTEDE